MSAIGTGTILIGPDGGITLNPGETATFTHNTGKIATLVQPLSPNGQVIGDGSINVTVNNGVDLAFQNTTGGIIIGIRCLATFELPSIGLSGIIPVADIVIT